TRRRRRTGAPTGAPALLRVRCFAQHAGPEREPSGPAPILRRSTPASSSPTGASRLPAGIAPLDGQSGPGPDDTYTLTSEADLSLLPQAQALDEAQRSDAERARTQAEKWVGGLTALLGLLSVAGIVAGATTPKAVRADLRWIVFAVAILALALAAAAAHPAGAVRGEHVRCRMVAWTLLIMFGCRMAGVWTCGSAGPMAAFRWCSTTGLPVLPPRCGPGNERPTRAGFGW